MGEQLQPGDVIFSPDLVGKGPAQNRAERRGTWVGLPDTKPKCLGSEAKRKRQAKKAARKKQRR